MGGIAEPGPAGTALTLSWALQAPGGVGVFYPEVCDFCPPGKERGKSPGQEIPLGHTGSRHSRQADFRLAGPDNAGQNNRGSSEVDITVLVCWGWQDKMPWTRVV